MKVIRYGLDGNKMSGLVCVILPAAKWVSLGFMQGTSLPDPDKLLEGSGKGLRHVKLRSIEDVDNPAVQRLLEIVFVFLLGLFFFQESLDLLAALGIVMVIAGVILNLMFGRKEEVIEESQSTAEAM
jgi:uncharacterized membrane protein HdeD (DUF308 family)